VFLAYTPHSHVVYFKGALIAWLAMESNGANDKHVLEGSSEEVLVWEKCFELVNEVD
jgi:hypothetical protein